VEKKQNENKYIPPARRARTLARRKKEEKKKRREEKEKEHPSNVGENTTGQKGVREEDTTITVADDEATHSPFHAGLFLLLLLRGVDGAGALLALAGG
jgi:hypothetical protein